MSNALRLATAMWKEKLTSCELNTEFIFFEFHECICSLIHKEGTLPKYLCTPGCLHSVNEGAIPQNILYSLKGMDVNFQGYGRE